MSKSPLLQTIFILRWTILLGVVEGASIGTLSVFIYQTIGSVTNAILYGTRSFPTTSLLLLLLALLTSILLIPLLQYGKNILLFRNSLVHDRYLINQFIHKPIPEVQKFSEGEIQYRLEQDPVEYRIAIVRWTTDLPVAFLVGIVILAMLFKANIWLALTSMAVAATPLLAVRITKRLEAGYKMQVRDFELEQRSLELDVVSGAVYFKMYGLKDRLTALFRDSFENHMKKALKKSMSTLYAIRNINFISASCGNLLLLLVGAWLVANKEIQAGSIMTVLGLSASLTEVYQRLASAIKSQYIYKQYQPKISELGAESADSERQVLTDDPLTIECCELQFGYGDSAALLNNMDIQIKPGQKAVIVGPNGTGKTTLLHLLSGMLLPVAGDVLLNGRNLTEICPPSYYRQYAYIEQEPYLFPVSLFENVHLAHPDATKQEVLHMIKEAGLWEIHEQGTDPQDCSGGEKQRISIARALLKGTKLIFMDEPSNHLDAQGKDWLKEILSGSDCTVVYVSHDPEFIKLADQVIRLTPA
jgi:ABC-type bacteriocin/lantibiotic exporter with double-glycine peptidase domain